MKELRKTPHPPAPKISAPCRTGQHRSKGTSAKGTDEGCSGKAYNAETGRYQDCVCVCHNPGTKVK